MPEKKLNIQDKNVKMALGIALALITLLSGRIAAPIAPALGLDDTLLRPIIRSIVGVIATIALGGASWLVPNLQKIRDSWHYTRILIMINIVLAAIGGAVATLMTLFGGQFTTDQLIAVLRVSILCIFVGINEEIIFRSLLMGGLLAGMGSRKNGPMLAVVISSVAFGLAHVIFDITFDNPLGIVQALGKTIESGLFGLILCVPILEGRNIVGAMTVHAFSDWVLLATLAARGVSAAGTYVSRDPAHATGAIIVFAVFSLLLLPKTIKSLKRINAMKLPQYGPFVPEEESARLVNTAWQDEKEYQAKHSDTDVDARVGKLRDHRVFNNRYLTVLATFVCYLILSNLVSTVAMAAFGTGTLAKVVVAVGGVLLSLMFVFGFQRHFAGELDGLVSWTTPGLLLALPAAALAVANILEWPQATTFNNPLVCLILAMSPGFAEEIIFRAIPLCNWMRLDNTQKGILTSVLFSAAVFGLVHSINIFAGATMSMTVFQVFYAFCLGIMLAAVFLRTGSIWPTIILHTFIDFTAFLTMDMNNMGVLTHELEITPVFWFIVVASLGLVAWAVYLLRPAKQAEVIDMWNRKWHK